MINLNSKINQKLPGMRLFDHSDYRKVCFKSTYQDVFSLKEIVGTHSEITSWYNKPIFLENKGFSQEEKDVLVNAFSEKALKMRENGQKLTKDNLYNLIQDIIPGIQVEIKDMSEYKGELKNAVAITDYIEDHGKFKHIIFVDFNSPISVSPEVTAHEFTHLLQNCSPIEFLLNQKVKENGGAQVFDILYNSTQNPILEDFFIQKHLHFVENNFWDKASRPLKKFFLGLDETKEPLKIRILHKFKNPTAKDLLEVTKMTRLQLDDLYENTITSALKQSKITNKELALFYLKHYFLKEQEAYTNGFNVSKKILHIEGKDIVQDFIPLIYKDMVDYIDRKYSPKI